MEKQFIKITLFLVIVLLLGACNSTNDSEGSSEEIVFPTFDKEKIESIDKVAEFEGGVVTGKEFANHLAIEGFFNPDAALEDDTYQSEALQYLVMEKKLSNEVEDRTWAEEQAALVWKQIEQTYDNKTRNNAYEALGITEEEIKNYIVNFYVVQDYFQEDITEGEISDYYEEIKNDLTTASFRHILVSTQEVDEEGNTVEKRTDEEALAIIEEIQTKLEEGQDFETLANDYNEDPGSAETNGLYEEVAVSTLDENFMQAVLQQEKDKIGEPVKTNYGYHLVQVHDLQTKSLSDVQDAIKQQLANDYANEYLAETVPNLITKVDESISL
ncbi:parvulin-like peptidyl-prolyl isomerase [Salirhabdus euzebyi]|uniref:peptidylprolyl isomerase n=1 Tax=Salirhabdus euzebyi TaxID=394506 RepID=A0A841Q608_9BACI|nr:peptidylprolyl isomerase [Salirhabdus euzebyi]MBB6453838.1 parvulin-like peptidyl-prolyl isomerase [Salirhabdus euzebyi]